MDTQRFGRHRKIMPFDPGSVEALREARRPVERLPADLHHARHGRDAEAARDQLARPGDARAHSQPRNASPAISSS